mmetsp:Transcript_29438/g.91584  ORF Transcript_29438/g.91584 Transcript_29438/m.91584 type:complete len:226 (+) Transcript_29438:1-678(+)
MQRAIEASLSENPKMNGIGADDRRQRVVQAVPVARDAGKVDEGSDSRGRTLASTGLDRAQRGAQRSGYRSHERPAKAATLGLGGCAWVDNSDFHIPRTNQMLASPEVAHSRSASCNAAPGRGRSTIVSLPQIQRLPPKEQQEMVKDLHDSIMETVSSPDESPFNGKGSLADISMETKEQARDRRDSAPRQGSRTTAPRSAGFNAQFHSCRNEQDANQSAGTPRRH